MSGHRGRPTTTGKSHNKHSNTYWSTKGSESVPKKVKTSNKTIQFFFKSLQQKIEEIVELSDSLQTDTQIIENNSIECTETDDRYESASTKLDILTDESISSPRSVQDEEEQHNSQKDIVKAFDGRRQLGLFFTIKWEKQFLWAYYSSNKVGWFLKTCEQYSDTGDQYWKTLLRKHDEHSYLFFTDHVKSRKHIQSVRNKQEVKQIFNNKLPRKILNIRHFTQCFIF